MKFLLGIMLLLLAGIISAQEKKTVEAFYTEQPITIDGILDEPAYMQAQPATDFTQLQPYNGKPSYQPSEVRILYDQTAIYIGGMFYDNAPDSIFNFLSERDNIGPSDYFGIYFDPYNEGLVAYGFFITPAGVQTDIKAIRADDDNEDSSWDAVWQSKTRVTDKGWIAELKIPYSALRFPENGKGIWGMNMFRNIKRHVSNNSWNFIDNEVNGFIHQQGLLTGIKDIKPPVRLSVSPFAAAYVEFKGDNSSPEYTYKGGMDLKYGISESFTLDMMLVPDFGQIQSDDKQLNLTPYELFYSEKRQFFTEGTELFDRAGIFYSRRIGASPKFAAKASDNLGTDEVIDYNPTETQLLNATKVSGRTSKGWGIGFLNAMTLPSYATLKDTITGLKRDIQIQPFTNYNVAVIEKSLKNNSYFSLINTNILMANNPYRANVTALDFRIRDKTKTYAFSGKGGISARKNDEKQTGFFTDWEIEKNSGIWQYGISQHIVSDEFNLNDLGYLKRNNEFNTETYASLNLNDPFGIIKHMYITLWWEHNRIYNPNTLSQNIVGLNYHNCFMNNWGIDYYIRYYGINYDYYEPRVSGRYYTSPYSYSNEFWAYTDSRKPLKFTIGINDTRRPDNNHTFDNLDFTINYRIGRHLQLMYNTEFENETNNHGYVDITDNEDTIYFARRNIKTIENVIEADYAINNKAGINLRMRHYWSGAVNKEFFCLQENGSLISDPDYDANKDNNYNAFNIDLIFKWIFAPGSELSVSWKNAIYSDGKSVDNNYWNNLSKTWESDQVNSFSVKMLYYIDYNNIRRKRV